MKDRKQLSELERLSLDDRAAMKQIFEAYYLDVFRVIFRVVSDHALAEDLSQEVFIKIWNKRKELQINSSLKGYLLTAAYREGLAFLRKNNPEILQADTIELQVPAVQDPAVTNELRQLIQKEVHDLPERCQQVFVLSRYEGKTYRQIADLLSISPKTVENQISKALTILREALKEYLIFLLLLIAKFFL